jgi:hypothetical protein
MSMQARKAEMLDKMRDILGEDYVQLKIIAYRLEEDLETDKARIRCQLVDRGHPDGLRQIEGEGCGLLDACFQGLLAALEVEYPSLKTISIRDFSVKGLMATRGEGAGSDAKAEVSLTVATSENHSFTFSVTSRSLARASVEVTLEAINYFVNSEKAFISTYRYLQHYRKEGRTDLVTKYQLLLGQMVQNTSYTEVIDQIKAQEALKG